MRPESESPQLSVCINLRKETEGSRKRLGAVTWRIPQGPANWSPAPPSQVSHGLERLLRRDIEAKVRVSGSKVSRTLTDEDGGQPAASHLLTPAHLRAAGALPLSAIAIRIHTGRRHQIRAHTRLIGHPTASDGWYSRGE